MAEPREDEEKLLRSVAVQNAKSILAARQRAEEELIRAKEALERKTEELAHSLSMMRATLESTTDGILVTDEHGTITDFNDNFIQIWKVGKSILNTLHHNLVQEVLARQLKNRERFVSRVTEIYTSSPPETFDLLEFRDGRVIERFSRIRFVNGKNVGRVWSYHDITERKQVEEALREESRLLERLNETGAMLSSNLDLQTLVQTVTDAARELTGAQFGAFFYNMIGEQGEAYMLYTLSGAPREAFESLGHPRATPLFGPTFRGEGVIRCEDVLKDSRYGQWSPHHGMPPGHLPVRSYLAAPVISRSGTVIGGLFFGHSEAGVFTERTERVLSGIAAQAAIAIDNATLFESLQQAAQERKDLLERERAARMEAERANAIKDEFLATLSHELRTPLSSILGWSRVLHSSKDEADLTKGLGVIERNARVQAQLIEDLLDMSRIMSGKIRLDIQPVEPVSFVEAAIETVRPAAEAKGIRLVKLLDPAAGPVSGDPNRLQQVVWNLLSNAIKFTPRNGNVQVVLQRVNSHIEISVADTGIGIHKDFLPHVFERFRQADASTTRPYGGLGLGLAIVKHLSELHGGTVHVMSAGESCGATFSVRLPLSVVYESIDTGDRLHPTSASAPSPRFETADLGGIRILVLDDEPDARELIKIILEECRAQVMTAASGSEALRLVETERPDVIVSDIGMPEMDGYDFLRRVRALGSGRGGRVPAVALTAFARSEDRTRALRAGFLVHIAKPVEPSELVATVASLTGRTGVAGDV